MERHFTLKIFFTFHFSFLIVCFSFAQIDKAAEKYLLNDSVISTGHIGISVYEPATNTYLYNYNATKNFIPASNVKLFTLYAGMKYLGDSLTGLIYQNFSDSNINIIGTGDPTLLHPDFKKQPVIDFLKSNSGKIIYASGNIKDSVLGHGWAWDDYNESFMQERNALPICGNIIKLNIEKYNVVRNGVSIPVWKSTPAYFAQQLNENYIFPYRLAASARDSNELMKKTKFFIIRRNRTDNTLFYTFDGNKEADKEILIPFVTNGINTVIEILKLEFGFNVKKGCLSDNSLYGGTPEHLILHKIYSRPSDSLFKPMMHNSDNFFAEQTLLMASNEKLGYMNDEAIIDTLLNNDLKDIPQKPKWVDGSGLSRYNLFTPQSFVYILNKMKNEFGWQRMKTILPTGGEGTLKNYYLQDSGQIYAKTGSLSNNTALSGYIFTKSGKILIFSILVNNFQGNASSVRHSIEKFIEEIIKDY